MTGSPRITPGSRGEIGTVNTLITHAIGLATGGGPPNVFTTLARQPRLFRGWLRFAGALMPGGTLPRADSELVILRVAHNSDCVYEWQHHVRLGRAAGLSEDDVERVRDGPQASGWTVRQALLLSAVDQLHTERIIDDGLWDALSGELEAPQLIELLMLVGHYQMLAATLNTLRIQPDALPARPSAPTRLLQALASRR